MSKSPASDLPKAYNYTSMQIAYFDSREMLSTSAVLSFSIRVELISAAQGGSIVFSTQNSNLSATPMHKPRHLFCVRGKNPCSQSYLGKYFSCKGKQTKSSESLERRCGRSLDCSCRYCMHVACLSNGKCL